jgi:D-alanine transaminase
VTDSSACNVFAVFGERVLTAPRSNAILAGVTREVTLELAGASGLAVAEESFHVDTLRGADEIFLTGTNTRILPIIQLDGETVGLGGPGSVTRRLIDLFDELTGFDPVRGVSRRSSLATAGPRERP